MSPFVSRVSSVAVATRCGLDGPGIEPGVGEIFCTRPDQPWGLPSLLYNGDGVFHGGKAAGVWRWLPTPNSSDIKERVELYLYSPSGTFYGELSYHSALHCLRHWHGCWRNHIFFEKSIGVMDICNWAGLFSFYVISISFNLQIQIMCVTSKILARRTAVLMICC